MRTILTVALVLTVTITQAQTYKVGDKFVVNVRWTPKTTFLRQTRIDNLDKNRPTIYSKNAIQYFGGAIRSAPKDATAHHHRGLAWTYRGEYDKAIKDFSEAIRLNPKNGNAYHDRGVAWDFAGDYDKAIQDFSKAIKIHPKFSLAYLNRAIARKARGDYDKAAQDCKEAIRLNQNDGMAHNNLAFLMASCPNAKIRNGAMAVKHATKACELSGWQYADYVDTLAAAYAETGNFTEAIKRQQQAIELAPKDEKGVFKSRLELYKQGKPFREKPKK